MEVVTDDTKALADGYMSPEILLRVHQTNINDSCITRPPVKREYTCARTHTQWPLRNGWVCHVIV